MEGYNIILRNSLCKATNGTMNDNQFLQAALPAAKDGLDVSSAPLLALFAFLASAVEAKKCLKRGFFGFQHVDQNHKD